MDEQKFDERLKKKFSHEEYSVIYRGKNSHEDSVIKCLSCGRRIIVNTGELFRSRRKNICSKCNYLRIDTKKNQKTLEGIFREKGIVEYEFFMFTQKNGIRAQKVRFTCGKCERITEKYVANILRQKEFCSYCEGSKQGKDHRRFKYELEANFPKAFTLLENYVDVKTRIKVRCNKCGFIRKVKPAALLASGYCPKCGKTISRGEEKIRTFLEKNNIVFEPQKYFREWNIGVHYFDFYLPQWKTVIEYHGKQHYEYNSFFHQTPENFQQTKEKDLIKKNAALANGYNYLCIDYTNYNNIPSILEKLFNSTTIPQGSRGKCLETETIQNLDEDIVWS